MKNKVRFGIIGCGNIAGSHVRSILNNKRAELIAVCDIEEEKAKSFQEKHGAQYFYTDYHEMLKRDDVDVVCICTPSGMHGDMTIATANAGKHVFCEKPLDITSEKMTEMIDVCRNNKVKLGCVYQRRLMKEAVVTKKAIDSGEFGKIVLADAYLKYYRSQEYYNSAGWRGTWELDGGGALMNQGVHGIDLIMWLAGDVKSVFARAETLARDIEVEDTALAILKFTSGAVGVIEGTTSVYPAQETRFEIHGENGSIIFGDSGFQQWRKVGSDEDTLPDVINEKVGGSDDPAAISNLGHDALIDDMISAVIEDRDPMITGESARKAVDLILAIYESSRTGKEVFL
ncbi:MAG: Gfo/Idh/MocA family oxidoreductase [Clostridiales bacterium]|nr:Gfo/Idh/MocA family oxidoreductase [Clostridiales bacterium]